MSIVHAINFREFRLHTIKFIIFICPLGNPVLCTSVLILPCLSIDVLIYVDCSITEVTSRINEHLEDLKYETEDLVT